MAIRAAELVDVAAVEALATMCGLHLDASRELALAHSELWVAEAAGTLISFGLVWFLGDEMEVIDIGVLPQCRQQGAGGSMLRHLLGRGRTRGARTAFLEVRASNAPAQGLYFKHGFARHAERRAYYEDGEDAWLLRCCLQSEAGPESA